MSIEKASRAGFSLLIRKIWGSLVNLIVLGILARELPVRDFGLVAAAMVLMNWLSTITSAGLDDFIILYKGKHEVEIQKAASSLSFWVAMVLMILLFFFAPSWAKFYGREEITNILYLLGFCFFFDMISVVPKALLRKKMNYKGLVWVQMLVSTTASVLKIVAVFNGWGVYSLILPLALVAPIQAFLFFYISKSRLYRFFFYIKPYWWLQVYRFTSFIIGSRLINKFMNEGDNLIVGKTLGMEALGLYNCAYQAANFLVGMVTGISGDVSTPVFAKMSIDTTKFRNAVLRMLHIFAFVATPVVMLLLIFAKYILFLWFGEPFLGATIPLQLLCIFAFFRMMNAPSSNIYNAMGQAKIPFYLQLFIAPLFLLCIYLASFYGLLIFSAAVALIRSSYSVVLLSQSARLISLPFKNITNAVSPFVLSFTPIAVILALLCWFYNGFDLMHYTVYILSGFVSIYIYFIILKKLSPAVWLQAIKELVRVHPSLKLLEKI